MPSAGLLSTSAAPDARAEALLASFERAGYVRVAPAILQPAEPFLDLSGEDIRKRMYLTTAPGGGDFCLRPDLTIPAACDYLASPSATAKASPRNFCRPASSRSAAPTRRRPTPKCWRAASKRPRIMGSPRLTS